MVLDNLGDSLKGTIKKIANAVHIDKKLVKEIVRDIQRALLQADVNVKLVLNLSKKIEKRALEEKPPSGMSSREHVIHIVYEELVSILGESRDLHIKKQIIMMVGLNGQGKCVHADSVIPFSSGDMQTAENIYNFFASKNEEESVGDGTIIDITDENFKIPSFNPISLKIENKKVTHVWKLEGKQLYEIFVDAGNDNSVKVTPEHPFFILRNGVFMQAMADQLQSDDYIAVPKKINTISKSIDFLPKLRDINLDVYLPEGIAKSIVLEKFSTIKEAVYNLKQSRDYPKFTTMLKKDRIPLLFVDRQECPDDYLKLKLFNSKKPVFFPRYLTSELAEFLGYVIGDGHITQKTVEISNADEELIQRTIKLSKKIFGITPSITEDKRSKAKRVQLSSTTLAEIFHTVFRLPYGKKGLTLHLPEFILSASDEVLSFFIRAYIDCDGYITKDYRNIAVSSESKTLLKQLNILLRRFNIFSTISKKRVKGKDYWKLCIESRYAEVYYKRFNSILTRKKNRLKNFIDIGKTQGCGKHDMIPVGSCLKDLRESLGHTIGKIQKNAVKGYGIYEKNGMISRESLLKLSTFYDNHPCGHTLKMLQMVGENKTPYAIYNNGFVNAVFSRFHQQGFIDNTKATFQLTNHGETYINSLLEFQKTTSKKCLEFLKKLTNSDVCWVKVRNIKTVGSPDFVYDFTVEDNHSFIADGVIVHNTTTCGKLATFFKKKGLRPALIAGDVHRPAAVDQLKQIAERVKVPCYGDKKEKDAVKVVKDGLKELKKSNDVIIVDTAGRHKLEKDLIVEMEEIFKATDPDEKLLVMDAAVGQQAGPQAKAFDDAVDISGIVLTKLDGTAKGGGALSAASEVGAPIVFIGTGEHPTDFESFDPKSFISRLLGMGDIKTLIEKAEESMQGKDAKKAAARIMSGKFTLHDMYDQMDMLSGMGSLSKIAEMLPSGFGGMNNKKLEKKMDMDETEDKLARFRIIMDSMTDEEMENPNIIRSSRINRIAKGAGVENKNVKELLKYYKMTKRMMKGFQGNRRMQKKLMKQLNFDN